MKVNTADVTFAIIDDDETIWAYDVEWSQCVYLMKYLR